MKTISFYYLLFFLIACNNQIDKELSFALDHAKENRNELKKVIKHYQRAEDSLKLRAAIYLIKNMPYNFALDGYFSSPKKGVHRLDFNKITKKSDIEKYCDSLYLLGYYKESPILYDSQIISADFLIENIELAFQAWEKPWAKHISFENFCYYILPYRAQNEIAQNLRKEIMELYLPILDSAKISNSLDACNIINERIGKQIKYGLTGSPFYPTLEETYKTGISTCDGLCNFVTYVMRAVGIPVVTDITLWSKGDRGHSWCAVFHEDQFLSFGPAEEPTHIFINHLLKTKANTPAKVYRKSFHPKQKVYSILDDGYETFVKNPTYHDVTKEYPLKIKTIPISTNINSIDAEGLVYLCVHNYYEWRVLAIGKRSGHNCIFEDVAVDNIFIVADSPDGHSLRYISEPFLLDSAGHITKFVPNKLCTDSISLHKKPEYISIPHTLYYWDTERVNFIKLPYSHKSDSVQTYNNIPQNALLWFTNTKQTYNQRIFLIDKEKISVY